MTSALSEQSQRLERFLRHKGMDYKEGEEEGVEAMDGRDVSSLLSQTLYVAALSIWD